MDSSEGKENAVRNSIRWSQLLRKLNVVGMFRIFLCERIQKELDLVSKEYFDVLKKQMILNARRRQLRAEQVIEELQGVPLFATNGYIALTLDIPSEMADLDARFERLDRKRKSLQKKLLIFRPNQFATAG